MQEHIRQLTVERDELLEIKEKINLLMGNIGQTAKRAHSKISESTDADSVDSPAKRPKLSTDIRAVSEIEVIPTVEKEADTKIREMESSATPAAIQNAQDSHIVKKEIQAIAESPVVSKAAKSTSRAPPTGPRLQNPPLQQRSSSQSLIHRIQSAPEPEAPWRVALTKHVLRKVDQVRNLFTIMGGGRRELHGIEMHLCQLFRSDSVVNDVIKRIDHVAIGSYASIHHRHKCLWATMHSCHSSINKSECNCFKFLPKEWKIGELWCCGWIEHVRAVDTGFMPRTEDGRIPRRRDARKTSSGGDWEPPRVLTHQTCGDNARWVFRRLFE